MIREHQYRSEQHNGACSYKYHVTPCGRPREDHEEVDYRTKAWDRDCSERRKAFLLYVDLDRTPGAFHTPFSAWEHVEGILKFSAVGNYDPVSIFFKIENQEDGKRRASFVIYVNLDPVPGVFHSQESAQNALRNIFVQRIPHYNPLVSLAPDSVQPVHILKGTIDA